MRVATACIAVLLLPLGPATAAAPVGTPLPRPQVISKACDLHGPRLATSGQVRIFKNPREFPPSDLHHAVDRRLGNCPVPAIIRRNVGR